MDIYQADLSHTCVAFVFLIVCFELAQKNQHDVQTDGLIGLNGPSVQMNVVWEKSIDIVHVCHVTLEIAVVAVVVVAAVVAVVAAVVVFLGGQIHQEDMVNDHCVD